MGKSKEEALSKAGYAHGFSDKGEKVLVNHGGMAEKQAGPGKDWKSATENDVDSVKDWTPDDD